VGFPEPIRKLLYRKPKLKFEESWSYHPIWKRGGVGAFTVPKYKNMFTKGARTTDAAVRLDVGWINHNWPSSRTHLGMPVKTFTLSRNFPLLIEAESSSTDGHQPEPNDSGTHPNIIIFKVSFTPRSTKWSLPSDSTTKILYTFLISSKRAIKTAYFITIFISNEAYQSSSFSLRILPQPAVNFSFLFKQCSKLQHTWRFALRCSGSWQCSVW